jgi:hypothetical protein
VIVIVMLLLFSATARSFAAGDDIPPLRPPHPEFEPSFWDLCRPAVLETAVVVAGLLAWGIARRWRPKVVVPLPPELLARRALEALRGRNEDGLLAMEVSRVVRQYCVSVLNCPPGERTTSECRQALMGCAWLNPDLAADAHEFLRRCDEYKFSPAPPAARLAAVETALKLVERIDGRRRETLAT